MVEKKTTIEECEVEDDSHFVSVYKYDTKGYYLAKELTFSTPKPVQVMKAVREAVQPRVIFTGYDKSVFWVIEKEEK